MFAAPISGTEDAPLCPTCCQSFTPRRKDQRYCSKPCAKAATRNAARGPRVIENRRRSAAHYDRASWLSYDLNRMHPERQRALLLAILEAASGTDAPLRNILLDPALLGADRSSTIGKLYPDSNDHTALNVAKMVHFFCRDEWGCSTRDAILDSGKPAGRRFTDDGKVEKVPPHYIEGHP